MSEENRTPDSNRHSTIADEPIESGDGNGSTGGGPIGGESSRARRVETVQGCKWLVCGYDRAGNGFPKALALYGAEGLRQKPRDDRSPSLDPGASARAGILRHERF
jgi:hypothetical protein